MRQAAADPGLAALSFHHASAEMLVQDPKRFDLVSSMEVVGHVDNPAAFEVGCGARQGLFSRCPPAGSISIDLCLFSFSLLLAWWISFPLTDCTNVAL